MRLAAVLAVLVLSSTACGPQGTEPSAAPESTAAAAPSAAEPAEEPAASPAREGQEERSQLLTGIVGTQEDPDAFVITLLDAEGEQVTALPAGEYEVQVTDHSGIHNFHLDGPGVDESTTVPETVETTWTVTLEEGEHVYRCDPHPSMVGSFTVT